MNVLDININVEHPNADLDSWLVFYDISVACCYTLVVSWIINLLIFQSGVTYIPSTPNVSSVLISFAMIISFISNNLLILFLL